MSGSNSVKIAFVGFGEVGQRFCADLLAAGQVRLAAYDIVFDDAERRDARFAAAERLGVHATRSAAEAAADSTYVISAVTASAAEMVACEAAGYLKPGQIFLDVNSASPGTKKAAAAAVEAVGAHYVEGAVMAPVAGPGIKVPILAGGGAAGAVAEALNQLGMNMTAVAREYGRASAMKLCRSIMIKGVEVLIADCAAASKAWNVEREVFNSLAATFPSIDWPAQAAYMGERIEAHGLRRAAEMREAADMLADLGRDPALARAVADAQERGAKANNLKSGVS